MLTKILSTAFIAGTISLSLVSGGAMAADLGPYRPYSPPPAPEPVVERYEEPSIWQGAYIGINGGYGWANSGVTDPDGIFGGGQIGYNWQRDRLVFGLEADIQAADMDDRTNFSFGNARSDIDWFSTVRARVGVTHGPALFYATGGVAFAEIDTELNLANGGNTISFRDEDKAVGYAVGGGLEWALAKNWTAKAEYLYLDFGDEKITGYAINGDAYRTKIDTDMHTVRLGLNYKF
jgi:outer membrane immunogenic protein